MQYVEAKTGDITVLIDFESELFTVTEGSHEIYLSYDQARDLSEFILKNIDY